jgi:hypothetical protein
MNFRLLIAFALIAIGGSDLLLWVVNGFSFGWFEFVFGVNVFSTVVPWTLIAIGFWLIKKNKVLQKLELELITELAKDEQVEYKQDNGQAIVIITNKKIMFRNYAIPKEFAEKFENVLVDEKRNIDFNEIESSRVVQMSEIAIDSKEKKSNKPFGLQIHLKSNEIFNIDIGMKSEIVFAHLQKQMREN